MAQTVVSLEGTEGKDQVLVVRIPVKNPLSPSASGKSLVVASTNGNLQTELTIRGKPVVLGLNAYIKNG